METQSTVSLLAVDDNPHNLLSLQGLLKELPVEFVTASSGEDALRRVLEQDFAVVLLDIHMPGMDGFETARLIRERPRSQSTPIIFLTAYSHDDEKVRRGYALGAVDFLFKPLVPEILRAKVSVFIEVHRKSEEIRHQGEMLRRASEREHEQRLAEERAAWERRDLQNRMERERRAAESLSRKADELARTVNEKERAEAALRESLGRIELLADTAGTLLSLGSRQEAVQSVVESLSHRLNLDLGWVHLLDEPERPLVWFRDRPEGPLVRIPPGEPLGDLLPSALEADGGTPDPISVPDLGPRTDMATLFGHRLRSQERALGSLVFGRRRAGGFSDDEKAVLQTVAEQLAMALDRLVLVHTLQGHANRLEEADRRKNDFLAMLGHELRNPLSPIVNALALVNRHSQADPSLLPSIEAAERQALHMARLVDDLLDVSRITQGKVELRKERVDLRDVVEQAVHTATPLIEAKRHLLQTVLPDEPVTIEADPTRLTQIVANLLNNAAKYSEEASHIGLRCRCEGEELVVEVQDEGEGMPPDQLEQVFDAFVQIHPTADRARGGLGLGLSLVKTLIELHGGSATAHSEGQGCGTTVTVRAPIVVADAEPIHGRETAGEAAAETVARLRRRILLVEDNEDIRITLRDLLELEGHEVGEASDGEAGATAILAGPPDIALVDIGLPGLNGYELARRVRSGLKVPVRLVALTGYGGSEVAQEVKASGFDAHLVKPVQLEQLLELLSDLP